MNAEKIMKDLKYRWLKDSSFQFIYRMLLDCAVQPKGMTLHEWYSNVAPKAVHLIDGESLDCRAINLDGLQILNRSFGYILDYSKARDCVFKGTHFQNLSAQRCDFTNSKFFNVQMSPIYTPDSIFQNCTFEDCFVMGIGPRSFSKGAFCNLTKCDFSEAKAIRSHFERCDFRESKLTNAEFIDCTFNQSDLRGVNFSGSQFKGCDFSEMQLDDSDLLRGLVQKNNNIGIEFIHWCSTRP